MPGRESPAGLVLEALGFALFLRAADGSLRVAGRGPEWLHQLWPSLGTDEAELPLAEASPFLENFLIDAEECWLKGGTKRVQSGPWIEQRSGRDDVQLDATALTAGGQSILLLERLGEAFEKKKDVLQRAREVVIAHQRLNSEMQKKEILLHYVAEDMTGTLANIVTSLRLIEREDNSPRTKQLLSLATRATQDQQSLINRVLAVFAVEIGGIYGREESADWETILRGALETVQPQFAEKRARLVVPKGAAKSVRIPGSASHLERVVLSLLQSALERTPAGGEVAVESEEEPDALLLRVTDNGPRLSSEAYEEMFSKFDVSFSGANASALRLHFSRIMVESSGGEIGCAPGEKGGNSFWVRLPKVVAA